MFKVRREVREAILSFFSVLLIILLINTFSLSNNGSNETNIQSKLEIELLENEGNYDSSKIVLNNTSKEKAKELADKLNAKLRITSDGSFATLSLQNGQTILDVVNDSKNKDILKYISIDYKAIITDILEDTETESTLSVSKANFNITDPLYNKQTYLDYINLSNVWQSSKGQDITVAVIDTGIDTDHPEFSGKISKYSYNATEDKIVKDYVLEDGSYDWSLVEDIQGHGTAVTGVIAASMNNGIGITGIAPNVTIITIKAECDEKGNFKNTSDLVFGLYYAIERDVDIVNMSFGSYGTNPYAEATKLAVDSDIICVAAAGNNGQPELMYPSADPNVIGVGALAENSFELATYSNYGDGLDLVAPGTVYTTLNDGGYGVMKGTSFASPIVAAIIALQMEDESYPYTYREYKDKCELLYASCTDLGEKGKDFYYGYGAIDTSAFILEDRFTVTFDYLSDEITNTTQVFIKGKVLQNMPEPERNYAVFDGWYYDIHCIEEYNLFADAWSSDLTLYCNWVNEDDGIPYTYVELEDGSIEIRSYTGKRRYITIPEYIDGKVVSSIGRSAFENQQKLSVVNLPSQLKEIKDNAFKDCINITSISIPDTVTSIGDYAFYNNIRLYNVNFTSSSKLEVVGSQAFTNCMKLTRFDIPVNVKNISGSTFISCINLKQINASDKSLYYSSVNGVLFNKSKTTLVLYPAGLSEKTYNLPESVKYLGKCSFAYSKIEYIDIENILEIGSSTFAFSSIDNIVIPDTLTSIGARAFLMSNISNIVLGKGISEIPTNCFNGTELLKEIIIPSNVQVIGVSAFSKSAISNIIFESESQLQVIGESAFAGTYINEIVLPDSLVYIAPQAFYKSLLQTIEISENSSLAEIGNEAFSKTFIREIIFPSSLYKIGDFAFAYTLLEEVNIPESVVILSSSAFAACDNLVNIYIDDNNEEYVDVNGVVYAKDMLTLHEYPAGKSGFYSILNGVVKIENYAFYSCMNLSSVSLPSSLEEIGECAFACTKLSNISIPDNVSEIGRYAFYGTYSLRNVNISNNSKLKRLTYASFAYSGIPSFTIPSNVSSIAQEVFKGSYLAKITFAANSQLESISAYVFKGCEYLETITFESGSKLTNIQAHAFEGMTKLKSIDFNDAKITNIDNYAFRYCTSLSSITLPETVEYIGRFAFYACSSLSKITIPENVEYIGRCAFHLTNEMEVYFLSPILPLALQEYWDSGIKAYYVGVKELYTSGDFELAKLYDDTIAIIKYNGNLEILDLNELDLGIISQIGGSAYENSQVKEIILPNTVKSIGKYAFANSKLENINMPDSLIQINEYAFYNSNIKNVEFSENSELQKIGMYAFSLCDKLTNIYIPNKVINIGSYAFSQSGLENVTFDENINISEISEGLFQNTKLVSVQIPNSVVLINHNAFRDVETLEEVNFGTSELRIMSNVFYNSGLTSVYIPENIEYIGEYAFVGLKNLNEFIVDENNEYYASIDGVLFTKDNTKLIAFPGNIEGSYMIPNTVEKIGFGAFENAKLEEISFEEGINLLTLGYRSFYNASNLKEIEIPESVVAIDYYAFAMCKSLETVMFSENSKLTGIYEGSFYGCVSLKEIAIPTEIYEISDYAFYGCIKLQALPIDNGSQLLGIYDYAFANTGIKELILPDSLLSIGNYAFEGIKVSNLVIPDANKEQLEIGLGAFSKTEQLEEITISFIGASLDNKEISWFGYIFGAGSGLANKTYVPSSLKKVVITEGQTILGDNAFYEIPTLEEIEMPSTIKYLGESNMYKTPAEYSLVNTIELLDKDINVGTFGTGIKGTVVIDCSEIEECHPMSFSNMTNIEKLHFVGTNSNLNMYGFDMNGCKSIQEVILPEGMKTIKSSTFKNCASLTTVVLPSTITTIEKNAFQACVALKNINIPLNVTSIGEYAFNKCTSLANIVLSENLESIGQDAFSECTSLERIAIPEKVSEIAAYTFYNCSSLKEIVLPENLENIGREAFENCIALEEIEIPYGVSIIEAETFNYCSSLKSVIIPSSVKQIENDAFSNCSSLESIIIPNSVNTIGNYAFSSCTNIQSIIFEEDSELISIGYGTFRFNKSLIEIKFPSSLQSIGSSAFEASSSLTVVEFEEDSELISIGSYAFNDCNIYKIVNNTSLDFGFGETTNGYIAYKAQIIIDKDGKESYKDIEKTIINNDFVFNYNNNEYTLVAYIGDESTVTLPLTINDNTYKIKDLVGVQNVIIPEGFTSIDDYAFRNCLTLTSIKLPSTLNSIGKNAFLNCLNLKEITIPSQVTSITNTSFSGCNINIISNSAYQYKDNILYDENMNIIYINPYAESIKLNSGLQTISASLFYNCTNLKEITIPASVITIDSNAFYSCTSLEKVIFEEGSKLEKINGSAFDNCTNLKEITIPKNVSYIGPSFQNCDNLEYVYFEKGSKLGQIENYTFYYCKSLKEIVIPSSVTSIGSNAFYNCTSLEKVLFEKESKLDRIGMSAFSYCKSLKEIVIPKSITAISQMAFMDSSTVIDIYYEGNREDWAKISFGDSYSNPIKYAKHVYFLDENNEYYEPNELVIAEGTVAIPSNYAGLKVHTLIIPNSVETIASDAFYGCNNLESVYYNGTVEEWFNISFTNSYSNPIKYAKHVYFLDENNEYYEIEEIEIPETKDKITYELAGVKDDTIIIPNTVKSIGNYAFSDCTNLETVYYKGTLEDWCNIIFNTSSSNPMYYAKHIYMLDENNEYYEVKELEIPETIDKIGNYQFYGFDITKVTLASSVTSIGSSAFYDCNIKHIINLSDISLSIGSTSNGYIAKNASLIIDKEGNSVFKETNALIYNGDYIFKYENNNYFLREYIGNEETITLPLSINGSSYYIDRFKGGVNVIIPEGFTSIGSSAFSSSTSLKTVVIPSTVEKIGDYAFKGCSALEAVYVAEGSLESIGMDCFSDCVNLNDIQINTLSNELVINNKAFYNTAYYNDLNNWENKALCLGNMLIAIDKNVERYIIPEQVRFIANDVFVDCHSLTYVEVNEICSPIFKNCTNIETLVLENAKQIITYFNTIPLTLKNVVIRDSNTLIDMFLFITNVNIYVDQYETDRLWNHDYPEWNNGNKVLYKGEWIIAQFYDENNKLIDYSIYSTSQIIRQPIMNEVINEGKINKFIGWDIDGDGFADSLPATSNVHISAKAIHSIEDYTYTVNYYDIDGKTIIAKQQYSYNDVLILFDNPEKKGYTFDRWIGYSLDMLVTQDMDIYSQWTHLNGAHDYDVETIAPTCTEKGYTKYVCSICDEEYKDNFVDVLGHDYQEWVLEKEPSCEEEGLKYQECSCGHKHYEFIEKVEHKLTSYVTKNATCTEKGILKYECESCDLSFEESIKELEHNYVKKYVSKTLIQILLEYIFDIFFGYEGSKAYYYECSNCGHIRTLDSESNSVAGVQGVCEHSVYETVILCDVTCVEDGISANKCKGCKEILALNIIYALGHTEVIDAYVNPTCTETGLTEGSHCSVCNEVLVAQEVIEVTHDPNEYGYCSECEIGIYGAQVNIGTDLSLKYYIEVSKIEIIENAELSLKVDMNDQLTIITNYIIVGNYYVFVFKDIAPQEIGDNINAYLYVGDEIVDHLINYSVEQNCRNLLDKYSDNTELVQLINDLFIYAQCAQEYIDYKTEDLVASDLELNSSNYLPSSDDLPETIMEGNSNPDLKFTSINVLFDNDNKLFVKVYLNSNVYSNFIVVVNNNDKQTQKEYTLSECQYLGDGVYGLYTDSIYATSLSENGMYSFTLKTLEGEVLSKLNYSVSTYLYYMTNGATQNEKMKNLALALYRYGESARAYVE